LPTLRAVLPAILSLPSIVVRTAADPQLADDHPVCRLRGELKTRLTACAMLLAAGTLTGNDLAIALNVRGMAFMARRDADKAIAAYSAQVETLNKDYDAALAQDSGSGAYAPSQNDVAEITPQSIVVSPPA